MNIKLFVFIVVIISSVVNCQEKKSYSINRINPGLKEDAGAVIRTDHTIFEVSGTSSAVVKKKFAVTIFNKDNQHYGFISIPYSRLSSIDDLEGVIYDSHGEEVRELDDKDIKDYSDFSGSLYDDNRVRIAELYHDRFPYTVEYTFEISLDGFINWPNWYSRESTDPVEESIFEVIIDEELRYWCNKEDLKSEKSSNGKKNIYRWAASNLPKLPPDATDDDLIDVAEVVMIAPSEFEVEGTNGEMLSWEKFGKWYSKLLYNRNHLPESAIKDVKNLVNGLSTQKEKINAVYKYMQGRTRYVSVQLGIGAWQPFDATYVHERSYGDCKALSNYMVSLLKEAGITAYPVLIRSGNYRLPIIEEFPSNQFNHVVVCVPTEQDTVWLECTSNTTLPGEIGYGNENRGALMITPQGGKIVKTPCSISGKNLQVKNLKVALTTSAAEMNGSIIYHGNQQSFIRSMVKESTPEEKEKWIMNEFEVPSIKLTNYSFDTGINNGESVKLGLNVTLSKYASVSGNRIFFNPNLLERVSSIPKEVDKRLSPVRMHYPYLDVDSIYYSVPSGYSVEALPEEVSIKSSFGSFSSKTSLIDNNTLLYVRTREMNVYSIPAESYTEYRKFYADMAKADRSQVVLVKKS